MAHEEDFWGAQLVRWSVPALKAMDLPTIDHNYLRDIGLPFEFGGTFRALPARDANIVLRADLPVIALMGSDAVCVNDSGYVVIVPARDPDNHVFVNSYIGAFGTFLMLNRRYEMFCFGRSMDDAGKHLVEIEAAMKAIDESALDSGCYWHGVIQKHYNAFA